MPFNPIDPKKTIPQNEEEILKFWQENKIFEKSVETRSKRNEYVFYDGPPFATGMPHYGHLLASTIKDVIPRYFTMKGYRVERRFGWDCHGLPIENLVEKELKSKSKKDIEEKIGIDKFNEACRSKVDMYVDEWEKIIERLGRWVDFKNDYKTMDLDFMESVMWLFAELHKKKLIYEGRRISLYCSRCSTPLSNFEIAMDNSYKIRHDQTATVKFRVKNETSTPSFILAWTTTPWTLPSNFALAVNPELEYAKIEKDGEHFICAKSLVSKLFGKNVVDATHDDDEVVPGYYFVTFNTEGGSKVFDTDEKRTQCAEVFREVITENNYRVFDLVVMTDHVHLTIEVTEDGPSLPKMLQRLKGVSSRKIKSQDVNPRVNSASSTDGARTRTDSKGREYIPLWRKGYDKKFILNEEEHFTVSEYIKFNPEKVGLPPQNYDWLTKTDDKYIQPDAKIIDIFTGQGLVDTEYEPLFPYFTNKAKEGLFRVVGADFVSDTDGTGIVHLAPFGEDDFNYATQHKLPIQDMDAVDDNSIFHKEITDFSGMSVIDPETNKKINQFLEFKSLLFHKEQHSHSYPHCYRCETPLIYKPQRAYFLDVQSIKCKIIANNKNINWVPGHLKTGRFQKGLESAPDWNLSRNRYWGSPIPIWKCNTCDHEKTVGSIEELEKLSKKNVTDLHKHFIDKYTWNCDKCNGIMHRTPEVLDCWFESGAMPYAQKHFPFENQEQFENTFPGDFVAEYIAQTRGWFYTLHVLSTALKDSHSFKNCICTGTIMAEDGEKMSKSKKNYPDPTLIFDKYGSDAMRYYLMASSVMKGENFNFAERGVEEVLKSVILPIQNAYNLFSTYANIDNWKPTKFVFVRHGEGEHNVKKVYSGKSDNPHHLTELGKKQAQETAHKLPKFDILYSSPFVRTRETVAIIKTELNFVPDPIFDDRLGEIGFGELEGKPNIPSRDRLDNKTTEPIKQSQRRLSNFLQEIGKTNKSKTICAVTHGGCVRAIETALNQVTDIDDYVKFPVPLTGKYKILFMPPDPKNELDKWILSELQTTIKTYKIHFDAYELETALRAIPKFIDNLNNWYLRRSRRRFWEGEAGKISEDKQSAYETLHHVLVMLSKLLAPVCPFFADKLYKDLTHSAYLESSAGDESVHLTTFPYPIEDWIDKKAESQVAISREIVRLAASIRARKKIKLRQPLQKLRFAISGSVETQLITSLPIDVIKEEVNVKEVEIIKSLDGIAQRIVKVDARKVGPRLGKKVQELIVAGKKGDFIETSTEDAVPQHRLEPGQILIAGEILECGEYEFGFLCEEGVEAESTSQTVVLLDTEITPELETEGYAREIIRTIQEMRKSKGFEVSDRIKVTYSTDSEVIKSAFAQFSEMISEEVLAVDTQCGSDVSGDSMEVDGEIVEFLFDKKE